ncbi:MAG: hypothetical protein ACRDK3_14775 [Actinomycetota bacterium]
MQQHTGPGHSTSAARPEGRTLTIVGFVLAGLALVIAPILLGPAAAICGGIAMSKGDPLGKWALVAGIAATILGFVIGAVVLEMMRGNS